MKKLIALILVSGYVLSGCTVVAEPVVPKVVIGGGGKHCPPGQAKKGNC